MEWMFAPLRRYADFNGRARRLEYWLFNLFIYAVVVAGFVVCIVIAGIDNVDPEGKADPPGVVLLIFGLLALFYLAMLIPLLAVTVRRFHDQDKSGWFVLMNFIPYVGGLIVLVFMCIDGTPGENDYGPDPKGRGDYDANVFA